MRLKSAIEEGGVNGAAIVRRYGLSKNRVSQMLAGHEPRVTDAIKVAKFLKRSVESLFGDEGETESIIPVAAAARSAVAVKPATPITLRLTDGRYRGRASAKVEGRARFLGDADYIGQKGFVPMVAWVAAGIPRETHDGDYPSGRADEYAEFAVDDPSAFALRVDGDSMSPDFRHGDIIIVSPKLGHRNGTFADGIAAVILFKHGRSSTFKIVNYRGGQRGESADYLLKPINPAFPVMRLKVGEIAAIYPVVGHIRMEP